MIEERANSPAEASPAEASRAEASPMSPSSIVADKPRAPRLAFRVARGALVTVATLTALIGLMHAPFARSFLMKIGGCPVGNEDAHAIEKARSTALLANRGDTAAPSHEAYGFALGKATLADIEAWEKRNDVACDTKRNDKDAPARTGSKR